MVLNDEIEQTFHEGFNEGFNEGYKKGYKQADKSSFIESLHVIANTYGISNQALKLIEETSEYNQALCKLLTGSEQKNIVENIKEELADILVVALQLRYLIGEIDIDSIMSKKVQRQLNRISAQNGAGDALNSYKSVTAETLKKIKAYGRDWLKNQDVLEALLNYYNENALINISEKQALIFLKKLQNGEIII